MYINSSQKHITLNVHTKTLEFTKCLTTGLTNALIGVSMYEVRKYQLGSILLLPHLETGQPFTWSSEPHEGLAICKAKAVPSFLSYFKSLSLNPAEGI